MSSSILSIIEQGDKVVIRKNFLHNAGGYVALVVTTLAVCILTVWPSLLLTFWIPFYPFVWTTVLTIASAFWLTLKFVNLMSSQMRIDKSTQTVSARNQNIKYTSDSKLLLHRKVIVNIPDERMKEKLAHQLTVGKIVETTDPEFAGLTIRPVKTGWHSGTGRRRKRGFAVYSVVCSIRLDGNVIFTEGTSHWYFRDIIDQYARALSEILEVPLIDTTGTIPVVQTWNRDPPEIKLFDPRRGIDQELRVPSKSTFRENKRASAATHGMNTNLLYVQAFNGYKGHRIEHVYYDRRVHSKEIYTREEAESRAAQLRAERGL